MTKKLLLITFMLTFLGVARAELVEFRAGTPAKASEVNSNFSELAQRISALEAILNTTSAGSSPVGDEAVRNAFLGVWNVSFPSLTATCSNGDTYTAPSFTFLEETSSSRLVSHRMHFSSGINDGASSIEFNGGQREFIVTFRKNHFFSSNDKNISKVNYRTTLKFDVTRLNQVLGNVEIENIEVEGAYVNCNSDRLPHTFIR